MDMTIYYLIVNDKGQPLYKLKTGQLFIYTSLEAAIKKLTKDMKSDWLAKRCRIIVKTGILVNL